MGDISAVLLERAAKLAAEEEAKGNDQHPLLMYDDLAWCCIQNLGTSSGRQYHCPHLLVNISNDLVRHTRAARQHRGSKG
jgi:hypothetical protein